MGSEEGVWEGFGWKQPEEDAGGGVQAPRDCSGSKAPSGVLTLKAIQSKACVLVSSDVTANH